MISYNEQIKNHTLHKFLATSVVSYKEHWNNGVAGEHCTALKRIYEDFLNGVTDREAQVILRNRGFNLDIGSVSARRNDLNKVWLNKKNYLGEDLPSYFIVGLDKKKNETGRTAVVWGINPVLVRYK